MNILDKEYALNVAERHWSKIKSITDLGGGSYGRAFKVELETEPFKAVVKLFKLPDMAKNESLGLTEMRKYAAVTIPEVYFVEMPDDKIRVAATGMQLIEGVNAASPCFLFKSSGQKRAFSIEVARGLKSLHVVVGEKFGRLGGDTFDTWQGYYKPIAERALNNAKRLVSEKKLSQKVLLCMQKAWKNFDFIFSEPVLKPVLIHGDLNVMNIMADKKTFRINGFIDPLNCGYADEEYDLFQLTNITGNCFKLYETYKKTYGVSEKCDLKIAFYALFNEVNCFADSGVKIAVFFRTMTKNLFKQMKRFGI